MKNLKIYISALMVTVFFSSCLKDKFNILDKDKSPSVVEFKINTVISGETPEGSLFTAYDLAYKTNPALTVEFEVNYSGGREAPQDIVVNLDVNPGSVDVFNNDKRAVNPAYKGFDLMPASLYTLNTKTVTIPAGQRSAKFSMTFKTDAFDFSKNYALPVKITSVSSGEISKNFGEVFLNVKAKNPWDGIYTYTSGATQTLRPNANVAGAALKSVTATRISTNLVQQYTNIVIYEIDPATNKVTVFDSGGIGTAIMDPSSAYDPATKTLRVKWTAGSRTFDETYVYSHSR